MKHIAEELIIDFALGQLSGEECEEVKHHIQQCVKCMAQFETWKVLLGEHNSSMEPHPSVREKVWINFQNNRNRRKTFSIKGRPIYIISSFVVVLLLFFGLKNYYLTMDSPASYRVAQNGDIPIHAIRYKPYTQQVNIVPVANFPGIKGVVWVNPLSNEMLLEVDGLNPLSNSDYQLWIIYMDDTITGEILSIENGSSRVFFEGVNIEQFKWVKASMEPKGGSIEQTGPDTFFVKFPQ